MSEIKQVLQAARDVVDACAGENRPHSGWARQVRDQIDTALSSAAVAEREPVATVAEVFVDGKRLYNITYPADALDKLPKGAALYLDPPPTSELEAEIARLKARLAEAMKALEPFADIADLIDSETEGMSETDELALHFHDYLMASWPVALFRTARRVREGGKVDG